MSEKEIIKIVISSWPVILFIFGLIFQAGAIYASFRYVVRGLKKVEKEQADQKADLSRKLYNEESLPRFVPTGACSDCKAALKEQMNREFGHRDEVRRREYDHLAGTLRIFDERVESVESKVNLMDGKITAVYNIMMELANKRRATNGDKEHRGE
jgi:hypothetical protein